jgi:excinuclease UvrABC nuclease subunit
MPRRPRRSWRLPHDRSAGEVLYVGKARHLKKRVQSYARGQGHNNRIARMVADTAAMEFVTTATEIERSCLRPISSSG